MAPTVMSRSRISLLIVLCVLVLGHIFGPLRPVEGWVARALAPAQKTFFAWSHAGNTSNQQRDLEAELSRLLVENARLKDQRIETSAVTTLEDFLKLHEMKASQVHVIGRSPDGGDQTLLLDQGSEQGIQKGEPVITPDGVLVGTIFDARPFRSVVLLATSASSRIAATVVNGRSTPGLVVGEHGLTMTMEFIPQGEQIEEEQTVVTSNLDDRIPENLVLGTLHAVTFHTGDLFQQATVLPAVDVQRLRLLAVVQSTR